MLSSTGPVLLSQAHGYDRSGGFRGERSHALHPESAGPLLPWFLLLGYIARHSESLAQAVVDSGAVPLLVLCFQEPELPLKRISASALSDIAKHSPELAQVLRCPGFRRRVLPSDLTVHAVGA